MKRGLRKPSRAEALRDRPLFWCIRDYGLDLGLRGCGVGLPRNKKEEEGPFSPVHVYIRLSCANTNDL